MSWNREGGIRKDDGMELNVIVVGFVNLGAAVSNRQYLKECWSLLFSAVDFIEVLLALCE